MCTKFAFLLLTLFLSACASTPSETLSSDDTSPPTLTAVTYADLPGWGADDFSGLAAAYQKSCARLTKGVPEKPMGADPIWGTYASWQTACRDFASINPQTPQDIRSFFETHFIPHEISGSKGTEGLFTGYYESSLRGDRTRQGIYQTPLRARPGDLVMVDLGLFREELKGQRIAGRVIDGNLKPYETHAEINAGKLPPAQDKPLVWVDDPADAFFVQIQGSGLVELADGSSMRIGYAGQNGHPYYAVGRELVKRGIMKKEDVSMQSIRDWMEKNPNEAQSLMETNPSYVFFQETKGEGPVGGEGVALTPGRSLAVDRSLIAYGMPVWLSAAPPSPGEAQLNRLMITQDTGGAIRGAVRGDVFWGHGSEAEARAGVMKSKGRYWVLLPKP